VEYCAPVSDTRWQLVSQAQTLLATLSPGAAQPQLLAATVVAEQLAGIGFPIAAPVRAADGSHTVTVGGHLLTVVRAVPGRPLDPADPIDQQWWGDLLGAAHRELAEFRHSRVGRMAWLSPEGGHLSVARWVRPAIAGAVAMATRLMVTDRLTYGVLHGDPAPESFRMDPATGRTGLVGWPAPATGPLAYDLAAAVGYAGGPGSATELIDGYLAAGPVSREEADAAVPVLLRYRLAERADRLARRIAATDSPPDREALEDVRAAFEELDKSG